MRELFIYWRTSAERADEAERAVLAWQAELCREFGGLSAVLYLRTDDGDAQAPATATLLETYAGAPLDAALEQRLRAEGDARLRRWLHGPRKVEVFVRCSRA